MKVKENRQLLGSESEGRAELWSVSNKQEWREGDEEACAGQAGSIQDSTNGHNKLC